MTLLEQARANMTAQEAIEKIREIVGRADFYDGRLRVAMHFIQSTRSFWKLQSNKTLAAEMAAEMYCGALYTMDLPKEHRPWTSTKPELVTCEPCMHLCMGQTLLP